MRAPSIVLVICGPLFVIGVVHAEDAPCNQEIMDLTKKLAASDAGSGSTTLNSPVVAPTHRYPGTARIGEDAQDKASSGQDVERRFRAKSDASQALEHAHSLDVQGKEAECMNEVMNAKQLAGL
jgi:hypothetical protein